MKRSLIFKLLCSSMFIMGLITMSGCSEDSIFEEPCQEQEISVSTNSNSETRPLSEVLKVAEMSRRKTRAGLLPEKIIPIVDQCDTLAYIINYVGNRGFAIISANKKVEPLLAYSEIGKFSLDNEIAKTYFVDKIKAYSKHVASLGNKYKSTSDDLDTIHYQFEPVITTSIGQWAPYDKIVNKHYPGCPAGCGPVAAVMIMSHCKDTLIMDNCIYHFKWINDALAVGPAYDSIRGPVIMPTANIGNWPTSWIRNYNGAISAIGQLLYDIGKRMKARYDSTKTVANLTDAHASIISAGYTVSSINTFDTDSMIKNINNGHMYFQHGNRTPDNGHFWVIDGFEYDCLESGEKINCYFYCHWGWDGSCDGYYKKDLFEPIPGHKYSAGSNFYVKIDKYQLE